MKESVFPTSVDDWAFNTKEEVNQDDIDAMIQQDNRYSYMDDGKYIGIFLGVTIPCLLIICISICVSCCK